VIGVALKGLFGRKLRTVLTAFAIVLGVAMISGSYVLTDTINSSFDSIYDETYKGSDAVVSGKETIGAIEGTEEETPSFPASVLREVEGLAGVDTAAGAVEDQAYLVDAEGELIGGQMVEPIGLSVDPSADPALEPLKLVTGDWPRSDRQIAIDKATAEDEGLGVGDTIRAYADGPASTYEIAGVVRYGSVDSLGGATLAVFELPTAQKLFGKEGELDFVRVSAAGGTTDVELTKAIRPLLPETAQVRTATAQAEADSADTQEGMNVFKYFLLAFGGIALFVGAFVIANTLSITVAQRMRELATLRTLGASRRVLLW
jgi:putative ABC transport system permease protein